MRVDIEGGEFRGCVGENMIQKGEAEVRIKKNKEENIVCVRQRFIKERGG